MNQFFYLIMLSLVEIVGDFSLEKYANNGTNKSLLLGILSYIGVVYFLILALKGSTILLVNALWDGISSILESLAAYIYLGERFDSPLNYIGLFLVIIGLFFLEYKENAYEKYINKR